jgi:hypothetical protein
MYLCVRGHVFVCLGVMYLCVRGHVFVCLGVSMLPLSTIFVFDFRNVPKLWYSLCFILLKEKQYNGQRKMINNTAQKALE